MKKILSAMLVCALMTALCQSAMANNQFECRHDLVEVIENTMPTCNSAGVYRYRCLDCGYGNYLVTPSIPHEYVDVTVYQKATCVSPGDAAVKCRVCDMRTRITKPIDPDAHQWREVSKTPSTCTSSGYGSYICNLCGKTENRTLPKGGHSYGGWSVVKEAGDFSMGERSRRCKVCGYTANEAFYPEGTMYRGGNNDPEAVTRLQTQLTEMGYAVGEIDGVYGKQTRQAVTDFQTAVGMPDPADGIGWPKTAAMIEEAWTAMMNGMQPTAEPTINPTPAPTEEPAPAQIIYEAEVLCCAVNGGTGEILFCTEHQALMDAENLLTASAHDNAGKIKALNQVNSLWHGELDVLNGRWLAAAAEDEKETAAAGVEAFNSFIDAQTMLWKQQYKDDEATALEKVNQMLIERCATVCAMVHDLSQEKIYTEKGYVCVCLTNGWYMGASMANDSITLHNDSIGAENICWITITDAQNIAGIEQAKAIARFNFPDGQFAELIVGKNSFQYITNEQGTMIALLAETSTGMTIKIDGRNCTLEQILPLIQTMEIR